MGCAGAPAEYTSSVEQAAPSVIDPKPAAHPWRKRAAEVAFFVAMLFAIHLWQTSALVTGALPDVALSSIDGAHIPVGARDRGYVVHFFATWCGVCRAEEGNMASLAHDHDVVLVASQSGAPDAVRAYVEAAGFDPARVALDPDGRIAAHFGVHAFPTTFYVDRAGRIATSEVGYTTELGMRLRAWWAE
jgi:thiol-disulfide isomerase/thioredoxin